MSARHPGKSCHVNLPPEADQSQPSSIPCFGPPFFVAYKKESSSEDITIDVCQGSICKYVEMQRAESKYLTDLEGSTG